MTQIYTPISDHDEMNGDGETATTEKRSGIDLYTVFDLLPYGGSGP